MLTIKSYDIYMVKTFGEWLFDKQLDYERSKRRRVNQTEFANHIGVSQATLSNWLNEATRPSAEAALKLAAKFDDYEVMDLLDYPNPIVTADNFFMPINELLIQFPEEQRPRIIQAIVETLDGLVGLGEHPDEKEIKVMLMKRILSKLEKD